MLVIALAPLVEHLAADAVLPAGQGHVAGDLLSMTKDGQAPFGATGQLLLGHGVSSLVGDPKCQPSPSVPDLGVQERRRPGLGLGGLSSVVANMAPGSPIRWGGGEPPIRRAGQLPAGFVDGPMMGPTEQGQVGEVGGAAVQPADQMMPFAPQASGRVQSGTTQPPSRAARVVCWPGAMTRLDRPRLSGWLGCRRAWATAGSRPPTATPPPPQPHGGRRSWGCSRSAVPPRRCPRGRGWASQPGCQGGLAAGLSADHDPGDGGVAGQPPAPLRVQGPAQPVSPPRPPVGWWRRFRSRTPASCGRPPPTVGSRPASRWRRASSVRASAVR
jgi:hypothetical protein